MMNLTYDFQYDNMLRRARIDELLSIENDVSLTSVVADMGYGKTQALMSYLSNIDAHVVWVPLTQLDNYPTHFWENFTNSLRGISPELSDRLQQNYFPTDLSSLHSFMDLFLKEVYKDKPFVMVFDDCHNITDRTVYDFIENLILIEIENLSFFILTRNEYQYHRVRELGNVKRAKITEKDLAFTKEEIRQYFEQQGRILTSLELNEVYKQTQGWPFFLYVIMLSLKELDHPIEYAVQYSLQMVFDVIEREVFSKYSSSEQRFLIQLSLLDFFPIKLIEDLTGTKLDVVTTNTFIQFNPHTKSYQFHQVFREFLNTKIDVLDESDVEEICRFAGEWFARQGLYIDALKSFQIINDYDELWRIINKVIPGRVSRGLAEHLIFIIESFPEEYVERNPMIHILHGSIYSCLLQWDKTHRIMVETIEKMKHEPVTKERQKVIGEAKIMLGFEAMLLGDTSFKKLFKEAYELLPEGSSIYEERRFMVLNNGDAITLKDNAKNRMKEWVQALKSSVGYLEHLVHGCYGMDSLAEAEANYHQRKLEPATEYAIQAIYKGKEKKQVDVVCSAYFLLIKIAIAKGQYKSIDKNLELMKEYADLYNLEKQFCIPEIARGWCFLKMERADQIPGWIILEESYNKIQIINSLGIERILKANYLLINNKLHEMLAHLNQTEQIYQTNHQFIPLIMLYTLEAIAYRQLDNPNQAANAFKKVYEMSHANDIIMPIVEFGRYTRSVVEYLRRYEFQNIPTEWMNNIHAKSTTYAKRVNHIQHQYAKDQSPGDEKEDLLSRLETEVLYNLCQGLTREEIADSMSLSLNTVKSILKTVYAKLGALNGIHAARIATIKGIIE